VHHELIIIVNHNLGGRKLNNVFKSACSITKPMAVA